MQVCATDKTVGSRRRISSAALESDMYIMLPHAATSSHELLSQTPIYTRKHLHHRWRLPNRRQKTQAV